MEQQLRELKDYFAHRTGKTPDNVRRLIEKFEEQQKEIELLNADKELLQSKWEAQGLMIQKLHKENERYEKALNHISTRKMSSYLTTSDMNYDFIKVAIEALI